MRGKLYLDYILVLVGIFGLRITQNSSDGSSEELLQFSLQNLHKGNRLGCSYSLVYIQLL